jgi:hypothetical protein
MARLRFFNLQKDTANSFENRRKNYEWMYEISPAYPDSVAACCSTCSEKDFRVFLQVIASKWVCVKVR